MSKSKNLTVEITGMSCASCAKRIEDAIGNIKGVSESIVNFATMKATVTGSASAEEIYKIIEGLGYGIVNEETPAVSEVEIAQSEWKRFLVSAILSAPVFIISMFMLHFRFSDLSQFILTTAVIFWPGIGFFKNALKQVKHRSIGMDSLIALGAGTAYGFSVITLIKARLIGSGFLIALVLTYKLLFMLYDKGGKEYEELLRLDPKG